MNAQEKMFWDIVQTAPFVEADEMLRARKSDAMERRHVALRDKNTVELSRLDALLTRINAELHRINRVNRDRQIQLAIEALFGQEAWGKVKLWLHENCPVAA